MNYRPTAPDVISGYSIATMGAKLAGLPDYAVQDIYQNGTLSATPRGGWNFIGPAIDDDSGNARKNILPFLYSRNVADFQLQNSASAQAWLEAARDALTVEASTLYEFFALIEIQGMGATTRTIATLFGGTATFNAIRYRSMVWGGVALAVQTAQSTKMNEVATASVLVATNTSAAATMELRGWMDINAGGTLIPQIQFSADPTGTILCKANSHFRARPVGATGRGSAGTWA